MLRVFSVWNDYRMWLIYLGLAIWFFVSIMGSIAKSKEIQFKDLEVRELQGRVSTLAQLNAVSKTVVANLHPDFDDYVLLQVEHEGKRGLLAMKESEFNRSLELGNLNKKTVEYLLSINGISSS